MQEEEFMKKLACLSLALLMALTLLPVKVWAVTEMASGNCGANGSNAKWSLDEQGTLTISGKGKIADYGWGVPAPWTGHRNTIKKIVIASGITAVGEGSFSGCNALTVITLPNSVTSIDNGAFSGCSSLSSITIPKDVTFIGVRAFYGCSSLENVYYAGTKQKWNAIDIENGNDMLLNAVIYPLTISSGNINGISDIDATDMACLYEYLTTGNFGHLSEEDFFSVADLNDDNSVDVYDLQFLYEVISGIKDIKDPSNDDTSKYSVAMITDYGDITDQSYNQTTYEACKEYCIANGLKFKYFKPVEDSSAARIAMIERAISEGFNIIVMPGYAFGGAIVEAAPKYKDVKFVALDVAKGDYLEAGVTAAGEQYDYNPDNWDLAKYADLSNVYTMIYQEELCGYMAGYATVKMGYTKLGYAGGMAVPAVIRYGYGFVQGANAAAKELGATVEMKYIYTNTFSPDASITAAMDTWYTDGTEVVFACGGGIYVSIAEAAKKANAKIVGVDVDQAPIIDALANEDTTITSAMKGLASSTKAALKGIIEDGKWDELAGKIDNLGLVSGTDMDANYVGIPTGDGTAWCDTFTTDDYAALVAAMFDGTITVSNDITKKPADFATDITLTDLGTLN